MSTVDPVRLLKERDKTIAALERELKAAKKLIVDQTALTFSAEQDCDRLKRELGIVKGTYRLCRSNRTELQQENDRLEQELGDAHIKIKDTLGVKLLKAEQEVRRLAETVRKQMKNGQAALQENERLLKLLRDAAPWLAVLPQEYKGMLQRDNAGLLESIDEALAADRSTKLAAVDANLTPEQARGYQGPWKCGKCGTENSPINMDCWREHDRE